MVKLRKRRYGAAYEQQAMVDLESAISDAIDQIEREFSRDYRVLQYAGQAPNVSVWDMVHFIVDGTVSIPVPTPQNAGKRVAISTGTGVTSATVTVASGTVNGVSSFTFTTANRLLEFVSNGSGWVSRV